MVQTDLREIALLDRRGTNSAKWDSLLATFGQEDLLPLWVADMDFKAPKCVRDALHQAVEQGAFGYYRVPDAYYESILGWEKTQHLSLIHISITRGSIFGFSQNSPNAAPAKRPYGVGLVHARIRNLMRAKFLALLFLVLLCKFRFLALYNSRLDNRILLSIKSRKGVC